MLLMNRKRTTEILDMKLLMRTKLYYKGKKIYIQNFTSIISLSIEINWLTQKLNQLTGVFWRPSTSKTKLEERILFSPTNHLQNYFKNCHMNLLQPPYVSQHPDDLGIISLIIEANVWENVEGTSKLYLIAFYLT